MRYYELVLVIKASLNADEKKELLTSVESLLGSESIKVKDDIGVLKAAYALQGKKENSSIHLVSYYLELDGSRIKAISKEFDFVKGLIRHVFYSMTKDQVFMTYADVQKKLQALLPEEEDKAIISH